MAGFGYTIKSKIVISLTRGFSEGNCKLWFIAYCMHYPIRVLDRLFPVVEQADNHKWLYTSLVKSLFIARICVKCFKCNSSCYP